MTRMNQSLKLVFALSEALTHTAPQDIALHYSADENEALQPSHLTYNGVQLGQDFTFYAHYPETIIPTRLIDDIVLPLKDVQPNAYHAGMDAIRTNTPEFAHIPAPVFESAALRALKAA